jgi:hypothetical protein
MIIVLSGIKLVYQQLDTFGGSVNRGLASYTKLM